MSVTERVRTLVEPPLAARGIEVVDVEHTGGTLRIYVDRPGGIDLDGVSAATEVISALLDAADPIPGRYVLEVSSPGVERPLRTPEHFQRAVGSRVAVRTHPFVEGARRVEGTLTAADAEGVEIEGRRLAYGEIERARTVFVWGPAPRPGRAPEEEGDSMNVELIEALQVIEREKGVPVDALLDAIANALVSAYKRLPNAAEEAVVTIDPDTGEIHVYAQELDEEGNVVREWEDTPEDFGRIAAQTAKQVIMQRIREVEREKKYEEYAGREGDIVTGIIQQNDQRYTLLDLGRVEALLPQAEQVPHERYEHGARLKAYIVEVRKTTKGPQIVVSRTHPGLIKRLFELEVPEIADGTVEIKAVAREPGHRTKIAVWSNDPNVDPVGACVGARGSRVRMVVNELRGEKVDIVPYSEDPVEFIAKALSPAKVKEVRIDEATRSAEVIVPDYQLSLAIGKEGQNARLAARLTGWRIDIKSESQLAAEEEGWAEGEWVTDPETGELVWRPAEGGEPVSAQEWEMAGGGQAEAGDLGAIVDETGGAGAPDGGEAGEAPAGAVEEAGA